MEYEKILEFFNFVALSFKKKYPAISIYCKYLKNLKETDKEINKEIDIFKTFLLKNKNIHTKILDRTLYKGSKKNSMIYFDTVLKLSTEEFLEDFWNKLIEIDSFFFPSGKDKIIMPINENENNNPMSLFENNPLLKDIFSQIQNTASSMKPSDDLGTMFQNPAFESMVSKLRKGLDTGKYKLDDLTTTIGSIINLMKVDTDEETQSTLDVLLNTMNTIEKGDTPDMSKLMDIMNTLQKN